MDKTVNNYIALAQQINEHFGNKGDEHDVDDLTQEIEKIGELVQLATKIFGDKVSENVENMILQRIFSDALNANPENDSDENNNVIEKKLTKSEIGAINSAFDAADENCQKVSRKDDYNRLRKKIVTVRNREHLDALIEHVLKRTQLKACVFPLSEVHKISENVVDLGVTIDLNFLDVSKITDMSGLFKNFNVSPHPEKGWFCKICLDISKWNVSNVTKMAHMFDCKNVDFGDLSKWNRSKVTDC